MISEHDRVVLVRDIDREALRAGDVGTVVHVYEGARAYEVEFVALDGATAATVSLPADQVRPIRPREMPHARQLVA